MVLEKYISEIYPTVGPFDGVNLNEHKLLEHGYLVVLDNDKNFYGILTPNDIVERPHKLVIDCLSKKESISSNDTIYTALNKFRTNKCFVLPVMNKDNFVGIIKRNRILDALELKINDLYNRSLISEKAKSNFLNNLSHEIRTPLNGIIGFTDIIAQLNSDRLKIPGEQFLDIIKHSADQFLLIMDNLIQLSLLHAGSDIKIEKTDINIENLFAELKNLFGELSFLQNKKTVIRYSNPDLSLSLYSDVNKIRHILYHLIDNAIKFSEDNKVFYGCKLKPHMKSVEFFVINKGPVLCEDNKRKIFDVFEKQENVGNKLNPGLGIGLSLAKKLTELLGGQIKVESKNNNTAFLVNMPIE